MLAAVKVELSSAISAALDAMPLCALASLLVRPEICAVRLSISKRSSASAASITLRSVASSDLRAALFWSASIAVPAAVKVELSSAISAALDATPS